jgi:hypothetical protein
MPKVCSIVIVAAALAAAAALSAQAQRRLDEAAFKLPDGDGRSEVIALCAGVCHPAARFANMRKSPAEWHKTVMLMVSFGAQLFPEDAEIVTTYLSTYLSDRAGAQGK